MTHNPGIPVSREAGGTIRAWRYVKDAPGNKVVECNVAGEAACGIAGNAADTTDHLEVAVYRFGDIQITTGAAIADMNVILATDSQGRAVAAVPGDCMLQKQVNGTSATAAGQIIAGTWFGEPQEIMA